MRQLILRFGYDEDQFEIAEAGNYEDVLPGTPLCWRTSCYETGEQDSRNAREELDYVEMTTDGAYWTRIARWDWIRDKYPSKEQGR